MFQLRLAVLAHPGHGVVAADRLAECCIVDFVAIYRRQFFRSCTALLVCARCPASKLVVILCVGGLRRLVTVVLRLAAVCDVDILFQLRLAVLAHPGHSIAQLRQFDSDNCAAWHVVQIPCAIIIFSDFEYRTSCGALFTRCHFNIVSGQIHTSFKGKKDIRTVQILIVIVNDIRIALRGRLKIKGSIIQNRQRNVFRRIDLLVVLHHINSNRCSSV